MIVTEREREREGGRDTGRGRSRLHAPFMDKKLSLKLNGGSHVQGILQGFDPFMNLVMYYRNGGNTRNSIIILEALEQV
ncbi:unnamed protein product [Nyctereutes procyonoides]|uniref:Sm protein G n=1 Tax=Nyctereutes procyonoides TaxID=34880 RepID=A0A811Y1Y7_NYCPR|nr:unnamed protein product [Nyctereutes procyonoides]